MLRPDLIQHLTQTTAAMRLAARGTAAEIPRRDASEQEQSAETKRMIANLFVLRAYLR